MKKWIILVSVIGVFVLAVSLVKSNVRYTPKWLMPKFADVTRGDIRVPISASGLIEPKQRIQVKSKASGEVIEVRVKAGDFVEQGDVLVLLKRDDEQRSVIRAEADLARMKALHQQALLAVESAAQAIKRAEGALEELKARGELVQADYDRAVGKSGVYSARELQNYEIQLKMNSASIKQAEASLQSAKIAEKDAKQAIKTHEANVRVAEAALGDAQQRLEETTVIASRDAQVTDVNVSVGEVIQGGASTFTGGTVMLTLADISELEVVAKVDEADYGRVVSIAPETSLPEIEALNEEARRAAKEIETRSGTVRLTIDSFPEETFEGVIRRVEPQGKLNAGSSVIQYDVRILITDDRRNMLPLGSQATVEFTVESALDVLRVPAEAVMSNGEQRGVWLKVAPPKGTQEKYGKHFIAAVFGITDGTYTEIIRIKGDEELKAGASVYTKLPRDEADKR